MVPAGGRQNVLKKSIRDKVHRPWRNSYTKIAFGARCTPNSRCVYQFLNIGALDQIAQSAEEQGLEPWGVPSAIRYVTNYANSIYVWRIYAPVG